MDRQLPVLDWQRLNDRHDSWSLPAFSFTAQDCVWLVVVVGLAAAWGADRWRTGKQHDAVSSALIDARAAAEHARQQELLASDQLRSMREELAALAAQLEADDATIAKLRGEISTLQADLRSSRSAHYASGRER